MQQQRQQQNSTSKISLAILDVELGLLSLGQKGYMSRNENKQVSSRLLPPRQTVKFLVMSKWDGMMGQYRKGPWCLRDKSSMNSMTKNTESQIHYDNP